MSEQTTSQLTIGLAPRWLAKAKREYDELTVPQRTLLTKVHDIEWGQASRLAMLHQMDVLMKSAGMKRKELCSHFPDCTASAVTKWFTVGSIAADHFAKLLLLPIFSGKVVPSQKLVALHGWRQAASWVRRHVQENTRINAPITFDAFIFLAHLHLIDVEDIGSAYAELPERLLRQYPDKEDEWLRRVEWEWGTSVRLLALEMTNET